MLKAGAKKGGCIVCSGGSAKTSSAAYRSSGGKISQVELQNETLTVYPNPSKGFFKINNAIRGNVKYELRSAAGQLVWTKSLYNFNGNSIAISLEKLNLKPGIYYLQSLYKNRVQTRSLVITK